MQTIKMSSTIKIVVASFVLGLAAVALNSTSAQALQAPVDLGTATPFAVLAGTPGIDNTGASVITGNVGLSPAAGSGIAGLLCTQVTGTIYAVDGTGLPCFTNNGPLLVNAKNDLTTAYTDASGRIPTTTIPTELSGQTLNAGVYISAATDFQISAGEPLILDAQGDPSAVFIFNAPASAPQLVAGNGSVISLVNQAQACNVYWRVDSAVIGTTSVFKGNILALNSITVANGANIEGRLLARNGLVSLINDTILIPNCVTPTGTGNGGATPTLPNTGSAEQSNNSSFAAVATAGVTVIATATYLFIRNKRLS